MPPCGKGLRIVATVGHLAAGVAISSASGYLRDKLVLATLTASALAPDVDFLIGLPHRTLTHPIGFATAVGVVVGITMWRMDRPRPAFVGILAGLAVASHLVLDILTAPAPIPAMWPLSGVEFKLAEPLIPAAPPFSELLSPRGVRGAILEIGWSSAVIAAAIWLDAWWHERRRSSAR
jgi:membrane-bound metal-dependent hydrolase YbcI (DUF457 family)